MEKQYLEEMYNLELLDKEITVAKLENEQLKRDCSESIIKERLLRENVKKLKESKQLVASVVSDLQKQVVLENINIDNKKREQDQIINRYYEMTGVCEHGVIILLKMNRLVMKSLKEKTTEFKGLVDQYLLSVKTVKEMATMKLNEEINRLNRVLKQVNAALLKLIQLKKDEITSLEEEKQKILTVNRQIKATNDVSTIRSLEFGSYDSNCDSFIHQKTENQRDIQNKIMKRGYFSKIPILKDYVKRQETVIKQCTHISESKIFKLQLPSKLIISSGIKSGKSKMPLRIAYDYSYFNKECEKKLKIIEKSHQKKDLNGPHCIRNNSNEVNNICVLDNNMFVKNPVIENFQKNVIDIPISESFKIKCVCISENNNEITVDGVKMNSYSEVDKLTPEKENLIEKQQCWSNKIMQRDLFSYMDGANKVHNGNNSMKTSLSDRNFANLNERIPKIIELENLSGIESSEVSIKSSDQAGIKLGVKHDGFNSEDNSTETSHSDFSFVNINDRIPKLTEVEKLIGLGSSEVSIVSVDKPKNKLDAEDENVHTGCGNIVSGDVVSCQSLRHVENISECFSNISTKMYTNEADFMPALEGSWKIINNEFMTFDSKLTGDSSYNETCQSELFTISFNNDNSLVPYMFK